MKTRIFPFTTTAPATATRHSDSEKIINIKELSIVALIITLVGISGCATPLKHLYKTTEAAMDKELRKTSRQVKPPRWEKKTSSVWVFQGDRLVLLCDEFFLNDSVISTDVPAWTYTRQTTVNLDAGIEVIEHTADPNSKQKEDLASGKKKIAAKVKGLKLKPQLSVNFSDLKFETFPAESVFNADGSINISKKCKAILLNAGTSKDFAQNAVIVVKNFKIEGLEYTFDNILEFGFEAKVDLKKLLFDSNGSVTRKTNEKVFITIPAQTHFWPTYFCTFWRSDPGSPQSNESCEKSIHAGGELPQGGTSGLFAFMPDDVTIFGVPVERGRIKKALKLENNGPN